MKKSLVLRKVFLALSLVLSHAMCTEIAFNYASFLCAIEHKGFSAPADIAFFLVIPYGIGIIICILLAFVFNNKAHSNKEETNK